MKKIAIIQARMGSSRLHGKVLMDICGKPVLWHIVNRVMQSKYLTNIVVATSEEKEDDAIKEFAISNNIDIFRGDQQNVLERFYKCAVQYMPDIVVRLTGDNVLIDPWIIDQAIECYIQKKDIDYIYYRKGLPMGMAVEVFSFAALKIAYEEAVDIECLEHVTPYIYKNRKKFKVEEIGCIGNDNSSLRWTIDTEQDYELVTKIYQALYVNGGELFHYEDVLNIYKDEWKNINSNIKQVKIKYQGEN